MGTRKVKEHSVDFCDVCDTTETCFRECVVCGRDYCAVCQGDVAGCVVSPDLCCGCASRGDVQATCDRWAQKLIPIVKKRDAALKRLPEKEPDK